MNSVVLLQVRVFLNRNLRLQSLSVPYQNIFTAFILCLLHNLHNFPRLNVSYWSVVRGIWQLQLKPNLEWSYCLSFLTGPLKFLLHLRIITSPTPPSCLDSRLMNSLNGPKRCLNAFLCPLCPPEMQKSFPTHCTWHAHSLKNTDWIRTFFYLFPVFIFNVIVVCVSQISTTPCWNLWKNQKYSKAPKIVYSYVNISSNGFNSKIVAHIKKKPLIEWFSL